MGTARQCINCGLLAMKCFATREQTEVDSDVRRTGKIPVGMSPSGAPILSRLYDDPKCLEAVYDLDLEYRVSAMLDVLQQPRECTRFVQWKPGFSPKEHSEVRHREEFEHRAKQQQDESRATDLAWQRQQEAIAETRHQESRRDFDRRNNLTLAVAVASAIAAIIATLTAFWVAIR